MEKDEGKFGVVKLESAGGGGFCFGPEATALLVKDVLEALPSSIGDWARTHLKFMALGAEESIVLPAAWLTHSSFTADERDPADANDGERYLILLDDHPESPCNPAAVIAAVAKARLLADRHEPTFGAMAALAASWACECPGLMGLTAEPDRIPSGEDEIEAYLREVVAMLTASQLGPKFICASCGEVVDCVPDADQCRNAGERRAVLFRIWPEAGGLERTDFCCLDCAQAYRRRLRT